MLAQPITKPVFDALFEKYSFAFAQPDVKSDAGRSTCKHTASTKADTLQSFYDSVKVRALRVSTAHMANRRSSSSTTNSSATPSEMAERLGIVYTEVVRFIHSVNHILKHEFGETLGSRMCTTSTRSPARGRPSRG